MKVGLVANYYKAVIVLILDLSASFVVTEIGRFLVFLLVRFEANENRKSASALTFVTLFAIVPLMTAGYSMLTVFPQFSGFLDQFHTFMFEHFFPASGQEMEAVLKGFATQAKNLTAVGLVLLLVSAISLMFTIENAFNRVWRVSSKRIGRRLIYYWLVILVGPVLLAVGFLMSSYLLSSRLWLEHVESVFHVYGVMISLLPFLFSGVAFSLMYYFLPSCKVRVLDALFGGLIAAGLLEGCKIGFVYILGNMPSYQVVYGAFAVVPLFLIWIFVAWCVVLLGAEVVRAIPFAKKKWSGIDASQLDWALMILKRLNASGSKRVSRNKLVKSLSLVDADEWEKVLQLLIESHWVKDDMDEYELLANLAVNTVGELSEIIHGKRLEKIGVRRNESAWFQVLSPLLADLRAQKKAALGLPILSVI
jgi:membrane protein